MAKSKTKSVREEITRQPNGKAPLSASDTPPVPFAEIGTTGLKKFGGEVQEEFDPNLRGLRGIRVFEEMRRNDPDIGSILFAILHIALGSTWTIEAASQDEPDIAAADFLREVLFEDMSHSWREFITDALTSNAFGWAWFELVFKQRLGQEFLPESRFDDGRIGLRKMALRGQETLARWVFDENGGIQGMVQRSPDMPEEKIIPIGKSLLVRVSSEKNNPEGVSMLRTAYRPYYIKSNMEEIEVIGAERDMTGVLVIYLPSNAQDADFRKAREMGERYRQDDQTYFIAQRFGPSPHEQWEFDTLKSPGQKVVDTDKTIQRSSVQIMRSVLAQFLTLGSGRTGSFALADSQKSLWHLAVGGRLDTLEEEINRHVVRKLFTLNSFPDITGLPKLTHSDPGEIDITQLTPFLRVLGELGMIDVTQETLEHVADRLDFPPPSPDAAERMRRETEESLANKKEDEARPGDPRNLPNNQDRQHQT